MAKKKKTSPKDASNLFERTKLPRQLLWLVDAPLFIDSVRIESFYDAVVRPYLRQGLTTIGKDSELSGELGAELGLGAEFDTGKLLELLSAWLPKLKVNAEGNVSGSGNIKKSRQQETQWHPINTPQRQLEQLVLHYLLYHRERVGIDETPTNQNTDKYWMKPDWILGIPRGLVLLDFPAKTKFMPTFGEFEDGPKEIFRNLGLQPDQVEYPVNATPEEKREYWKRFVDGFVTQTAVKAIEDAGNGKIDAIDFRVPVSNDGHTLHLHFQPRGKYPTITFAYNLLRRCYEQGVRLVGTIKSGPDINVLAIYEK